MVNCRDCLKFPEGATFIFCEYADGLLAEPDGYCKRIELEGILRVEDEEILSNG